MPNLQPGYIAQPKHWGMWLKDKSVTEINEKQLENSAIL